MQDELPRTPVPDRSADEWAARLRSPDLAPYWLAAVIESADDAIISKTLDGIITSWNKGAERIFGYTADEVIGKPVTILIPEDHPDEEPSILARLRAGERIEHYETVRVRKGGELIDISLTVSPVRGPDGKIVGASKIARDITDRKRAEAERERLLESEQRARREAEEANRLKDDFLATVSHELRTPLTAILGWVRMLRDGSLDDETAERALAAVERNAQSQAQLVEDLLDISRIVSGKMRLDMRMIDPSSVIHAAVEAVKPAAQTKGIRLQLSIDPNAGPVAGDFERLQQVVWNLLSNAVKFTPSGGRVEVCLERCGSAAELTVKDDGRGINSKFLPFVFDRFKQADSSITRAYGGMGVGLSIVKSITEMHGGTVRASSEGEGHGASFTVALPLASARAEAKDTGKDARAKRAEPRPCPKELDGLKVLVVDDDVDACEMIRATFEHCGSRVKTSVSAAEALALVEDWNPNILVADISMPEMDGYQLIRRVRTLGARDGGGVPAVALTALARVEDRVKALSAGYQMHVSKPVEPDELREVVASLVRVVFKNA
ncbi:MAG: PAS domain S-box protein [Acidobacteriota bacterium]|nr:PAS domain S-box protein [Acidobacteriota bacterium]